MNQQAIPHVWDTDLACERRRVEETTAGIEHTEERCGDLSWERIRVVSDEGASALGRPIGQYDTLSMPLLSTLGDEVRELASEAVCRELTHLSKRALGHAPASVLVVGLGNASMTADAVGPLTASKIHATRHIRTYDEHMFEAFDCAELAVLRPGVLAQSGLEALDIVSGACRAMHPELILVIDALAARSTDRLGRTVQISDTGITPGSGVGNHRTALDRDSLGAPVLALGVPTVTDSRIFFREEAHRRGIQASEDSDTGGMFVSPRDIDDIVACAADVLSEAINRAFGISFL